MNKLLSILCLALAAAASAADTRPPAVSGHFYPAKPADLTALVDRALAEAATEAVPVRGELVALLVPHAGLEFSGVTAARSYGLLKRGAFDAVIVVGTCHYKELEGAALYPGAYGTPEGSLPYAADLAGALMKASPLIKADAKAHRKEHSIEVQVPFLRRTLGRVPLAALVMNTQDLEASRKIGRAIAQAVKGSGKRVLLVASSDQSHFPSGGVADAVDRTTLAAFAALDPAYFWLTNRFLMNRSLPHLAVTFCGEGAVTAVLVAARELGATGSKLLAHINSGDVVSERDYNHVVGYAAAVLTREAGAALPPRFTLSAGQKRSLLAAARDGAAAGAAGRQMAFPLSADPSFNLPAALFVTLRTRDGELRGCVGSPEPQESLFEAAGRHGAAAAKDGRFQPVKTEELASLKVSVSVLGPSRHAKPEDVKPGDGVSLELEGKSGLFLPEVWQDLPKKEKFLEELCAQKAGLPRACWKSPDAVLKTFSAETFSE